MEMAGVSPLLLTGGQTVPAAAQQIVPTKSLSFAPRLTNHFPKASEFVCDVHNHECDHGS